MTQQDVNGNLRISTGRRALEAISRLQSEVESLRSRSAEPIAIVGIGCRFPGGADGPAEYFELLRSGRSVCGDVPASRWDRDRFYSEKPAAGKMVSRRGAFLPDVEGFDARFFGVAPREAARMDPQHRLVLEVAWEALEDAGESAAQLRGTKAGVFVGIMQNDFGRVLVRDDDWESADPYYFTGNSHSFAAGRIAYGLGLRGPTLAVDTACSSSLVAVHLAVQSLRGGECGVALAGGVSLMLTPEISIVLSQAGALAPDGVSKTFDHRADGMGRGEGAGVVVLKRLSDAIADSNQIYAVIRGSGVNHCGAGSGITVPNGTAQEEVIRSALASAGISGDDVDYVEAHGTGTKLGDPIEVQALLSAERGGGSLRPLYLGSAKATIGHLDAAAGVAGLIKAALCVRAGVLPPQSHFEKGNPEIPWDAAKVVICDRATPWPARGARLRRAGVSSFGMSGVNSHVVVEEPPQGVHAADDPALVLLPLTAQRAEALPELARRYVQFLRSAPAAALRDIAHTAALRRSHHAHRLAVVGGSHEALARALEAWLAGDRPAACATGSCDPDAACRPLLFFPGDFHDYRAASAELLRSSEVFRAVLRQCDAAFEQAGSRHSAVRLLESDGTAPPEAERQLVFSAQLGVSEILRRASALPLEAEGEGFGATAAAVAAGRLSLEQGVRAVLAGGESSVPAGTVNVRNATIVIRITTALPASVERPGSGVLSLAAISEPGEALRDLLRVVAEAFVHGMPLGRGLVNGRVVSLPRYPWQKERFAAGAAPRPARSAVEAAPAGFLTERVELADGRVLHRGIVCPTRHAFLADHRRQQEIVFPGAAYVAAILRALNTHEGAPLDLARVRFERPLVLSREAPTELQILEDRTMTTRSFRIHARRSGDASDFALYMRVDAVPRVEDRRPKRLSNHEEYAPVRALLPPLRLRRLMRRCPRILDREAHYARMQRIGMDYGAAFRTVTEVRLGERELLARIDCGVPRAEFVIDPALLDGCLQAVVHLGDIEGAQFVPVRLESVRFFATPRGPVYCHAVLVEEIRDGLVASLRVLSESGELLAEIAKLRLFRADGIRARELLYGVEWRRRSGDMAPLPESQTWVVLADEQLAGPVVERARSLGVDVVTVVPGTSFAVSGETFTVRPGDVGDLREVLNRAARRTRLACTVVDLWGLRDDLSYPRMGAALALTQAAISSALSPLPKLVWVTSGQQVVGAGPHAAVEPSGGGVGGLSRVAALENPSLRTTCVDIDRSRDAGLVALEIVEEARSTSLEIDVAYRAGERYVARLVRREDAGGAPFRARSDAAYVLTGGLGGIGLALADWLAAKGATKLALLSRGAPGDAVERALDAFRARGVTVRAIRCDVSKPGAVHAVLETVRDELGPVAGVIHAAGILRDSTLMQTKVEDLSAVLAPKLGGARALVDATAEDALDFFVVCSSVSSLIGNAGQASYAAANAALDSFVRQTARSGRRILGVNFGAWAGVGMLAGDPQLGEHLARRGFLGMSTEEAIDALERAIGSGESQMAIMRFDPGRHAGAHATSAFSLYLSSVLQAPVAAAEPAAALGARLRALSAPDRAAALREELPRILAATLGMEVADIDPQATFDSFGLDSMMGLEFKNKLEQGFGLVLPVSTLWSHPSCERLAAHLEAAFAPVNDAANARANERAVTPANDGLKELARLIEEVQAS